MRDYILKKFGRYKVITLYFAQNKAINANYWENETISKELLFDILFLEVVKS